MWKQNQSYKQRKSTKTIFTPLFYKKEIETHLWCLTHLMGRIHGSQQMDWEVFFMLDSLLFPNALLFLVSGLYHTIFSKDVTNIYSLFSITTRVMKNHECTQSNFHWNKEELAVLGKTTWHYSFFKRIVFILYCRYFSKYISVYDMHAVLAGARKWNQFLWNWNYRWL